jgi:hypothetical protein
LFAANNLNIITRAGWGARTPFTQPAELSIKPSPIVIITQTNSQECNNQTVCLEFVRKKQFMDMNQFGKNDINDNFIIGGDGNVYEARGWNIQSEIERSYDLKSIFITFVGDYSQIAPTQSQIDATFALLQQGVSQNKLIKKYKLLGLRQVMQITYPGIHLYNVIKTWKRWVPIP